MKSIEKLHLNEISSLLDYLYANRDVQATEEREIEVNGKKYKYFKTGYSLVIYDENNKGLNVVFRDYPIMEDDTPKTRYEIEVSYLLGRNAKIVLQSNMTLDPYESIDSIKNHFINDGMKLTYKSGLKEVATFQSELDSICLVEDGATYTFDENGIKVNNRLISLDGNHLISIKGDQAPSVEEIYSFDLSKERAKVQRMLEDNQDLHKFTREIFDDVLRKLEAKEREIKRAEHFYTDDVKGVRKAIAIRNYLQSALDNGIMAKDDIEKIADAVNNNRGVVLRKESN